MTPTPEPMTAFAKVMVIGIVICVLGLLVGLIGLIGHWDWARTVGIVALIVLGVFLWAWTELFSPERRERWLRGRTKNTEKNDARNS